MGSKFRFPVGDGTQSLYNTANDLRRHDRELSSSVPNSVRPLIPRVWTRTEDIGSVSAHTGNGGAWHSKLYTIPRVDGYADIFATFSAFGSNVLNSNFTENLMWILINGRAVTQASGIVTFNPVGNVPIAISLSLNVLPGDTLQLAIAPTNGDPSSSTVTTDVRISLHAQYTNPIQIEE
ncbi:hypothetical protein [Bifidobacterium sp. ESL0790]|uniref:hypothetical protein n=1 Tax=Bifidobacterium sp. ESL0790 TaxID=2983233 RepID=UPI0023F7ED80|nr:hypothetical protein [Bifidobacterium sp. ESL0790]WEV72157.1 hypothetical protein OZY47_06870 [Bifidobacterium sp. ESL0790]